MKGFLISDKALPLWITFITAMLVFIANMFLNGAIDLQNAKAADVANLLGKILMFISIFYLAYSYIFKESRLKNWAKYKTIIYLLICSTIALALGILDYSPSIVITDKFINGVAWTLLPLIFGWSLLLSAVEDRLTKKIDALSVKLPGYLEAVKDASAFQLEGVIFGWNPNWALELNNSESSKIFKPLERVHVERLRGDDVTEIQYVFLEGYRPPNCDTLCFGVTNFMKFLSTLCKNNNGINLDKYKIWTIPQGIWADSPTEPDKISLKKLIKEFLHVVVIAGTKEGTPHSLIFFNMRPFVETNGHTHCLKIKDEGVNFNPIQNNLFEQMRTCGIKPHKISIDSVTKKLSLQEATE